MRNENFITIQWWMINELGLTGNDLICYALIYGFTQNGSYWEYSTSYIGEWLGISKRSVIDILKRLVDYGCLDKKEYEVNGVKFCQYKANVVNFTSGEESSPRGGEDSSPCINTIVNKQENKENIKRKKEVSEPTQQEHEMFEDFRKRYKGKKRGHDTEFNFFIKQNKDWREVLPMLGYAIEKENALREQARTMRKFFPEQKNMQTYLNGKNRSWEVYTEDLATYDKNSYNPQCDGVSLFWNDLQQCYITPFDVDNIADGYTKDERPDGAMVMWRGYKYIWDSITKKWVKQ